MSKTLKLTLHKKAFDVMITGEKRFEVRRNSRWIESRLLNNNYTLVEFKNGYHKDAPAFICKFLSAFQTETFGTSKFEFSNGLAVEILRTDWIILLGDVVSKSNVK